MTSDGAVVNSVYIDDGNDDVILSGSIGNVTVNTDVNVVIDGGSSITTLTVTASGGFVTNNGSIGTFNANADGVVVDGNKPNTVNTGSGVTTPPVDKNGNPLKGGNTSTTGGSGGGGGGKRRRRPRPSRAKRKPVSQLPPRRRRARRTAQLPSQTLQGLNSAPTAQATQM